MREISRDPEGTRGPDCSDRITSIPTASCCSSARCSLRLKTGYAPGSGFTHHLGDKVTIATPELGALVNTVQSSTEIAPWRFGVRALYEALAKRQALARAVGR